MSFWRSARAKWKGLFRLPAAERWLFLESLALLPLSALILNVGGLGSAQGTLSRFVRRRQGITNSDGSLDEARAVARSVDLAAVKGPWPANCLQRSVVAWWLLQRRGLYAELRIGVRREGPDPEFHAWVEHRGQVLNDTPDVGERYSAFDRTPPPRGARFD